MLECGRLVPFFSPRKGGWGWESEFESLPRIAISALGFFKVIVIWHKQRLNNSHKHCHETELRKTSIWLCKAVREKNIVIDQSKEEKAEEVTLERDKRGGTERRQESQWSVSLKICDQNLNLKCRVEKMFAIETKYI